MITFEQLNGFHVIIGDGSPGYPDSDAIGLYADGTLFFLDGFCFKDGKIVERETAL
jgi:hypothetical protein